MTKGQKFTQKILIFHNLLGTVLDKGIYPQTRWMGLTFQKDLASFIHSFIRPICFGYLVFARPGIKGKMSDTVLALLALTD